jgi:hypothetical protein
LEKCDDTKQLFADFLKDVIAPEPRVLELIRNCQNVFTQKLLDVFASRWKTLEIDISECSK